ncbi:MAG: phosphomannomutase/phosphoglucomutase [Bacilli bacterium]|nr:phosphomannomutase/phosphoglucomutase [Bacilli bacterium]MDD4809256.1 phosphomannomutase/phosphoglucomutase [Bacilli bacterium]
MSKINPLIFRAYDIRGVYPIDINEEMAYTLGQSLGTYISIRGKKEAIVGYDNRLSSPTLSESLIKGITSTGIDVIDLGLVTTPMFYYARYHLNIWSGMMITASHNPSHHNGFKMSFDEEGNALGDEIQDFYQFTIKGDFVKGEGKVKKFDIKEKYLDMIKNSLELGENKIKVAVDCGNGTTAIVIKDILDSLPIEYDLLYAESDPTFPNHHPDPSVPENLIHLQKRVTELNYDFGFALDADGDRIGIVDHLGNVISNDFYLIIMYRFLKEQLKSKTALFDVKCSKSLIDEVDKLGLKYIMSRTGNSYVYRRVKLENVELGGEYSGHIFFNDRFPGFDDGIYAGLRMIEVLSKTGKTIPELLTGINKYYSTPEIKLSISDEHKFLLIEEIKKALKHQSYHINETDGIRIEDKDFWVLIRASNTTPSLTMRFEAASEPLLDHIQKDYLALIDKLIKEKGFKI